MELLPNKIKNDPEIKKQIEIKELFYQPDFLVINDFLNKNSKNDSEKTKLAIELIDEGLIANLFTISAQDILNDYKLAFNNDIKYKIIEKIKNDKIIQNLTYKNYQNGNQFEFLTQLGKLPNYLLDDQDIIEQIKMAIYNNMSYAGGFKAIYNEFIDYKLVISEKIKDLALVPMAVFFDNVMKKDEQGNLIYLDFLEKNVFPVIYSRSAKETFILFEILKDGFENNESKNLFYHIMLMTISDSENKYFNDNEFSRLKGYMTEYVNTLTEDKKSNFKDQIEIIKNLGLLP